MRSGWVVLLPRMPGTRHHMPSKLPTSTAPPSIPMVVEWEKSGESSTAPTRPASFLTWPSIIHCFDDLQRHYVHGVFAFHFRSLLQPTYLPISNVSNKPGTWMWMWMRMFKRRTNIQQMAPPPALILLQVAKPKTHGERIQWRSPSETWRMAQARTRLPIARSNSAENRLGAMASNTFGWIHLVSTSQITPSSQKRSTLCNACLSICIGGVHRQGVSAEGPGCDLARSGCDLAEPIRLT